jgi:hypothetical protein
MVDSVLLKELDCSFEPIAMRQALRNCHGILQQKACENVLLANSRTCLKCPRRMDLGSNSQGQLTAWFVGSRGNFCVDLIGSAFGAHCLEISDFPDVQTRLSQSAEETLQRLSEKRIDLLVTDAHVGGGLPFLAECRRVNPDVPKIVLEMNLDGGMEKSFLEAGAAAVFQMPNCNKSLRSIFSVICFLAAPTRVPINHLPGIPAAYMISALRHLHHTGIVIVKQPPSSYTMHMQDGDIIHAEAGGTVGEAAALGLLRVRDGWLNIVSCRPTNGRSILRSTQSLLMESNRGSGDCRASAIAENVLAPRPWRDIQREFGLQNELTLKTDTTNFSLRPPRDAEEPNVALDKVFETMGLPGNGFLKYLR